MEEKVKENKEKAAAKNQKKKLAAPVEGVVSEKMKLEMRKR